MKSNSQHKPTQVVKPVVKPATTANTGQHDRERERRTVADRNDLVDSMKSTGRYDL